MKDLLLHNWHLKMISLVLATALWAQVARTPTSEIGLSVSVEYQNIPPQTEVFGEQRTALKFVCAGHRRC